MSAFAMESPTLNNGMRTVYDANSQINDAQINAFCFHLATLFELVPEKNGEHAPTMSERFRQFGSTLNSDDWSYPKGIAFQKLLDYLLILKLILLPLRLYSKLHCIAILPLLSNSAT